jgi:hypothetical protein
LLAAAKQMQNVSTDHLGKYSYGDLRIRDAWPYKPAIPSKETTLLTLWSSIKRHFFPKGLGVAFMLVISIIVFSVALRKTDKTRIQHDLAFIGLLSILASSIDMSIAIIADGNGDMPKHLLLANAVYDVAMIAFANTILLTCIEFYKTHGLKVSRAGLKSLLERMASKLDT